MRDIWEAFLLIPAPWRWCLVLGVATIIAWVVLRGMLKLLHWLLALGAGGLVVGASLALWPEFVIARRFRRHGQQPPQSIYGISDVVYGMFAIGYTVLQKARSRVRLLANQPGGSRKKRWLGVIMIGLIPWLVWEGRPYVGTSGITKRIDRSFDWLISREQQISEQFGLPLVPPPQPPTVRPAVVPTALQVTQTPLRRAVIVHVAPKQLRVRAQPTTDSPIIGRLAEGQEVDILDVSSDGTWIYIRLELLEGWVSAEYLRYKE